MQKPATQQTLNISRRGGSNKVIYTFGMQVAAEALKLAGQQHYIRLIDLLGRIAPAGTHAANAGVGRLYFLQSNCAIGLPQRQ